MTISEKIVADFVANDVEFITTVPCKQLAGVIDAVEANKDIYHIPVTVNTLVTLTQYYRMPLPMLISYRGELREPVACQVEMAVHTKALLNQLNIPTYHFHKEDDVEEFDAILKYTFMCNKPVAILTDASFWGGYGESHR